MKPILENPNGLKGTWEQAKGSIRGGGTVTGHGTEEGMLCRAQRHEAKDGGWWVWVTSRWTALCDGRGGGERVQDIGDTRTNSTDGGGGGIEGVNENIKKTG